ncbi:MAG TPA: hypothetical protein VE545_07460 [Candidatus Dormibacteraeota bacterium]|nr:hypothetical protein [Candidatus Dormibacteraeota bacterium]
MIARRIRTSPKSRQQGYALLMVVFMTTAMLILAMMVAPNILTEGKREKEKEMIWRGKQYTRGVKLYYRKLGHFPTSLDDLTKPKIGSLRFLRQAYKDPMNAQDGSWRLIYVGPAGQLIGSLKPQTQNLQFGQPAGFGTPAGALNGPGGQQPGGLGILGAGAQSTGFGFGQQGQSGTQPGGFGQHGQSGTQPGGSNSGTNPPATTGAPVSADQGTDPNSQPIPTGDTPNIVGGNIIGVGSKINKPSIMVYEKAKNYRLFEFIWDPSKDTIGIGQAGLQTGTGLGQVPGQNPFGQQPGQNPTNPPQQPPQNPQQQPQNPQP